MRNRLLLLGLLFLLLLSAALPQGAQGKESEHIGQSITSGHHICSDFSLRKGDVITVELSLNAGERADFYLFTSEGYRQWSESGFICEHLEPGTEKGRTEIQYKARIPETDTYSVVISNPSEYGQSTITVQGTMHGKHTLSTVIMPITDFLSSGLGLALMLILVILILCSISRRLSKKTVVYICAQCKREIPDDSTLCPYCGIATNPPAELNTPPLTLPSPPTDSNTPPPPLSPCEHCGILIPENSAICPHCGEEQFWAVF